MNLESLNSPLPKPWLNIQANSVTTSQGSFSVSPDTEIKATPTTLTVAQTVNGIINQVPLGADLVLNLPAAADFNTYFGGELLDGFTFDCTFYKASARNVVINLGTGVLTAGGGNSITMTSVNATISLYTQFVYKAAGQNWVVFFGAGSVP